MQLLSCETRSRRPRPSDALSDWLLGGHRKRLVVAPYALATATTRRLLSAKSSPRASFSRRGCCSSIASVSRTLTGRLLPDVGAAAESEGSYGWPRVHAELRQRGDRRDGERRPCGIGAACVADTPTGGESNWWRPARSY